MKRKRPKTVKDTRTEWEATKTDEKFYTPNEELIRAMLNAPLNQTSNDFYNGEKLDIWMEEGMDMAEIHQIYMDTKAKYEANLAKINAQNAEKQAQKQQEEFEKLVNEEIERRKSTQTE